MEPLTPIGKRAFLLAAVFGLAIGPTFAQTQPACVVAAVPLQVRAEGLTERMGDIVLDCSGSQPGTVLSGNIAISLPAGITNRVDSNNQTVDTVLFVNYGSGFVPSGTGQVTGGSSHAGRAHSQAVARGVIEKRAEVHLAVAVREEGILASVATLRYEMGVSTATALAVRAIYGHRGYVVG
jgi:hypothetical protein